MTPRTPTTGTSVRAASTSANPGVWMWLAPNSAYFFFILYCPPVHHTPSGDTASPATPR